MFVVGSLTQVKGIPGVQLSERMPQRLPRVINAARVVIRALAAVDEVCGTCCESMQPRLWEGPLWYVRLKGFLLGETGL